MPTKYRYPITDHRGNVMALTDETGTVVARREYNAFGEVIVESGDWSDFRFGMSSPAYVELKDAPDGDLVITPTRTYYRGIGRFLQRDPQVTPQVTFIKSGESVLNPTQWPVLLEKAMQLDNYVARQGNSSINVRQAVRNLLYLMWDAEVAARGVSTLSATTPGNPYSYSANPLGESDPTGQGLVDCGNAIKGMVKVQARAAQHLAQNAAYFATHGTIDAGHIKEKKQILGKLEDAMQKVTKHCFQECPKEAYEKAKETLEELKKQIDAFGTAVANLDWTAALTALRNALIAVAILLALALAALPALALA